MTSLERARKIVEHFTKNVLDVAYIAAQIEEACAEMKMEKCQQCFDNGFHAARKQAKGIATDSESFEGREIAQRIEKMEP